MRNLPEFRASVQHPYEWLWEPLESEPSFVLRAMFGAKAVYLDGKLQLCFTAKEEPWRGMLICTEHLHHASLVDEYPMLSPHPVLPKWLYLPELSPGFEATARRIVDGVKQLDRRIGVSPKQPRRRKPNTPRRKR